MVVLCVFQSPVMLYACLCIPKSCYIVCMSVFIRVLLCVYFRILLCDFCVSEFCYVFHFRALSCNMFFKVLSYSIHFRVLRCHVMSVFSESCHVELSLVVEACGEGRQLLKLQDNIALTQPVKVLVSPKPLKR